jgi:hypothetical protein
MWSRLIAAIQESDRQTSLDAALVMKLDAGGDQHDEDRRDDPVDD